MNTTAPDTHQDAANKSTAIPNVQLDTSNAKAIVPDVRCDVTSTPTVVSDIHRDELMGREGADGRNQAVSTTRTLPITG